MCLCPTIQLLKVGPKSIVAMWGFRGFSLLTASLATEHSESSQSTMSFCKV